ncbi:ATP-binding cassette domain-containing protein [Rubrimonas cliftonensis]|uniref:Peptide/nickel transport system ATP-binding protein n=1 Tax=Rubrimonas cliftonensis TaxID=89524 RepID=A0A1H4G2S2_9RHOB|nr:ATP-binding cassette domain-containing protein [Rubrimonas cliftonensis]SEB03885.1 peptide/nickel transport system ATP-binding protein [Rubrimonas cliftonensis]
MSAAFVEIERLSVAFRPAWPRRGPAFRAVEDVSLHLARGERLGLVGESGSGKSTLGRALLRLIRPETGRVRVGGLDPFALRGAALMAFRRRAQVVFQDSEASLDPRMTVGAAIREGLDIHRIGRAADRAVSVARLLERVGLSPEHGARHPHALSGGQRQRVNIARALALGPELLVADEPVSALDVSVQAQILNLLRGLHAEFGLTLLFISHDLAVVRALCDRVAVMQAGRIVECGQTERLFSDPRHPYTRLLLESAALPENAAPSQGGREVFMEP